MFIYINDCNSVKEAMKEKNENILNGMKMKTLYISKFERC